MTLTKIDTLTVTWPDGKVEQQIDVETDQHMVLKYANAVSIRTKVTVHHEITFYPTCVLITWSHRENNFDDFDRDRLMYQMLSTQGPAFAKADLNGDGYEDFFSVDHVTTRDLFSFSVPEENFNRLRLRYSSRIPLPTMLMLYSSMPDNDGDDDLYVVSGGSEQVPPNAAFLDRLYENVGTKQGLPIFRKTNGKTSSDNTKRKLCGRVGYR